MRLNPYLIIALLALVFYFPLLGKVHLFDWDEINFAEASREMILTGDYLRVYIDFQPFWEKPPFFFWLQALSMKLIGINEYAARLPNAICGLFSLWFIFKIGKRLYNEHFAWLWTLIYLGSLLPHFYFKSGIIDPWFNLFIFSSLYYFIRFVWQKDGLVIDKSRTSKWTHLVGSGLLAGLAVLTKGPAGLLILGLCFFVYWVSKRLKFYISIPQFLAWLAVFSLLPLTWFGLETLANGPWFVQTFIEYQIRLFSTPDAGHGGFFGYHFVVLLVGCFPASFFAIRAFLSMPREEEDYQTDFLFWMKILFWVVLILFSIVQSKIVHYSSLAYFPLTYLASLSCYKIVRKEIDFSKWIKVPIIIIGGLIATIFLIVPSIARLPDLSTYTDDPFIAGNLEASPHWSGWETLPGFILLVVLAMTFYSFRTKINFRTFYGFFLGTALFISTAILFYVNRVEAYSQRAAVEFLKSKADEDCYVIIHGYKSYAHLFYTRKRQPKNKRASDTNWLLRGRIDQPVYVITKVHKAEQLKRNKRLNEVGRKNGFVFFKREVPVSK